MSNTASGVIEWVGSRAFQGNALWSFKMNDTFYRCGQTNPQVNKGDTVSFSYETDGKGNHNVLTPTIEITSKAQEAPAAKSTPPKEDWNARSKYWEDKEARDIVNGHVIRYQSATNTAVELVKLAQAEGILPVTGSKKGDKFDALVELVGKVRDDLIRDYERVEQTYREHGTLFPNSDTNDDWSDLEDNDEWPTD